MTNVGDRIRVTVVASFGPSPVGLSPLTGDEGVVEWIDTTGRLLCRTAEGARFIALPGWDEWEVIE